METKTNKINPSTMLAQVANSKGTEWMVSSYNEWQQRSPLPIITEKSPILMMRIANKLAHKENQLNTAMALSFRTIIIILGLFLSFRSR